MGRAADIFRWRGATSGDPTVTGNWIKSDGTTWADGSYPGWDGAVSVNVDGDTILLDGPATHALAGGDLSGKGQIARFEVTSSYVQASGTTPPGIGSSGNPLILSMQATGMVSIDASACGDVYAKGAGTYGLAPVTLLGTKVTGTRNTVYLDGLIVSFTALKGVAVFKATAHVTGNFKSGYVSNVLNDVTVTIPSGVTIDGAVECDGGQVTCSIALSALTMTGGQWTQSAGNIASPSIYGGTLIWNGGDITTAVVAGGGVLDGSQSDSPRTLTLGYANFGGEIDLNNGSHSITLGDGIWLNGGSFDVTPGTKVSV